MTRGHEWLCDSVVWHASPRHAASTEQSGPQCEPRDATECRPGRYAKSNQRSSPMRGYDNLAATDFVHDTVNHNEYVRGPHSGNRELLESLEARTQANLLRLSRHLDRYLDVQVFRFNHAPHAITRQPFPRHALSGRQQTPHLCRTDRQGVSDASLIDYETRPEATGLGRGPFGCFTESCASCSRRARAVEALTVHAAARVESDHFWRRKWLHG